MVIVLYERVSGEINSVRYLDACDLLGDAINICYNINIIIFDG